MGRGGFTLVEMLVVVALIGTLLAISTLQFNQMSRKSGIEAQTRELLADLIRVRSQALFQKKSRSVTVSGGLFAAYSSTTVTAGAVSARQLKSPVTSTVARIDFDEQGMTTVDDQAICVNQESDASVDSIIVNATYIHLGKRKEGQACGVANIDAQ